MCNFISWVELPDGKLAFLTDEDVFSRHGRRVLQGCRDNDFLGHGAIRRFFGLGPRGTDREVRDFWNLEKLPQEIADKIREFDKHWGRMWRAGFFQNDDLIYIIINASEEWKEKAWRKLLKQNPSNLDLRIIIRYAPNPSYKAKAAEQLLKQKPSSYELRYITSQLYP